MAILAAKMNVFLLFGMASACMIAMHTISTILGAAFPMVLSAGITAIICVVLFYAFGIHMLYEGLKGGRKEQEEEDEAMI